MRYIYTLLLLLTFYCESAAQDEVSKRIILIGNAREAIKAQNGLLDHIRKSIVFDSNTIVLFLGNNVLSPFDTLALSQEAAIIEGTEAKAFFIPGFRDWANGQKSGMDAVLHQEQFLNSIRNPNIKFYPGVGCPGPKQINLGNDALMLIMDSQWWLHQHTKPDIESECKFRTKEEVLSETEDLPRDERDKLVLFITHHPFENTGIHSGSFGIKQHIFPLTDIRKAGWLYLPLPVIGSIYPLTRNAVSTRQDGHNETFQSLASTGIGTLPGIRKAFRNHPYTLFISGQEQNMQLLKKDRHYFINSGASGTPSRVRDNRAALYVRQQTGFTVLELTKEKKVHASFYVIRDNKVISDRVVQVMDYSDIPKLAKDTAKMPMVVQDSFVAKADARMANVSGLRRLLIGDNYRAEWSAPVKMRVLRIREEKGGMKITGMGGGHESKSLQLEDASGTKWVLRSANKQLDAVIPEGFQETIASKYIQDMLSASHPYGALTVPGLQRPLEIVAATPSVYFIPNDTALGEYRTLFANTVGTLEERKPALNKEATVSTTVALNDMVGNSDHATDQARYLQVRLTDFLIADFDRHHGQYSWGKMPEGGRSVYYPIPKDRDQTFYHNEGLIMKIARHGGYEFMVNFPYRIKNMTHMGLVGAYMDMHFTNQLTADDWRTGISTFSETLTDEVIDSSVMRLPPEIYRIHGKEIRAKLKSRRQSLALHGMNYYSFISKRVNILGGNKDELFRVSGTDSGLRVEVYTKAGVEAPSLRYGRTFREGETREIRMYGFNGEDYFDVDESAKSGIRLKVIGGQGDDTFNIKGRVRNHIYDLKDEQNYILSRRRTTKMFSGKAVVNEYRFREPLHHTFSLPFLNLGANPEDGFIAGTGIALKTFGFRKYPYGSLQRISGSYAFTTGAYQLKYSGEFINVFRHYDLLPYAELFNPVLRNFFGYGNESVKDPARPIEFYRTRYNYLTYDLLVRKRLLHGKTMSISVGPTAYHYGYDAAPNQAKILEHPASVGLDSGGVYSKKFYGGGKARFVINTLNSELLPVRGINWTSELTMLQNLNENAESYSRLTSNLDIYAVLNAPDQLLVALHFGGGHIFSKHFEYFQALTLGGHNYLRGYRINRFAGSSMAYASAELKLKLFDFNAYLIKGHLGLVGFNDIGRVWMPNDNSRKWHHGYGGGVYLVPFNTLMLSLMMGVSEEEQLLNLSLGTRLNMVFQGL